MGEESCSNLDVIEPPSWLEDSVISQLLKTVLFQEIVINENSYVTCETLFFRIIRKMMIWLHIHELPPWNTSADLFQQFHNEIKLAYEAKKKNLSTEEQVCVERVLSKDAPHANELVKFASMWMKHDPNITCKWFAVDGTLGSHPKFYVHEAFSSSFEKHTTAVRHLYSCGIENPEDMKRIVQAAFDGHSDLSNYVELYLKLVGKEGAKRMADLRAAKSVANSSKFKRKRDISQDIFETGSTPD